GGFPRYHCGAELVQFVFTDHVGHGGVNEQHLERRNHALAVLARQQLLGNDPPQRFGDHIADDSLLFRWKGIDEAVERARRIGGVHRPEYQVPGLGRRYRQAYGIEIAEFRDDDDIRILPQRRAQGRIMGEGMRAYLPLGDAAVRGLIGYFDRLLYGDDMIVAILVHHFHERSEGAGFAATDGTGDQYQALGPFGQFAARIRQTGLLDSADARGYDAGGDVP